MGALITLVVAVAVCIVAVMFGPELAQSLAGMLGDMEPGNYALLETIIVVLVFGPLLIVALVGGAIGRLNPMGLGAKPIRMAAIGTAIGLGGLSASVAYAWVAGAIEAVERTPSEPGPLLWGTLVILFAAAVEEIYFRGWLQPVLTARFGATIAVLLSALAFAALHFAGGSRAPLTLLNLFLGGLLFGLLAARGGGIAGALGAHFAWNWAEQIVLGLIPNPGVGSFGAIAAYDLVGPAVWGGSDEGLNASIAMSMALAALLIPLMILMQSRRHH